MAISQIVHKGFHSHAKREHRVWSVTYMVYVTRRSLANSQVLILATSLVSFPDYCSLGMRLPRCQCVSPSCFLRQMLVCPYTLPCFLKCESGHIPISMLWFETPKIDWRIKMGRHGNGFTLGMIGTQHACSVSQNVC